MVPQHDSSVLPAAYRTDLLERNFEVVASFGVYRVLRRSDPASEGG